MSDENAFGAALRRHREVSGLSVRAAASRTHRFGTKVSEARWRHLEAGHDRGHLTVPRPQTAVSAARAVAMPPRDALTLAGHDPDKYRHLLGDPELDDTVPGFGQLSQPRRDLITAMVREMQPDSAS